MLGVLIRHCQGDASMSIYQNLSVTPDWYCFMHVQHCTTVATARQAGVAGVPVAAAGVACSSRASAHLTLRSTSFSSVTVTPEAISTLLDRN